MIIDGFSILKVCLNEYKMYEAAEMPWIPVWKFSALKKPGLRKLVHV
jgi:hypothetical protein